MRSQFLISMTATLVLSCMIGLSAPVRGAETVITHPLPAIYQASAVYLLRANGKAVPVVDYNPQYDYTAFAVNESACKLEITRVDGNPITRHSITPMKLNIVG